MKLTKEQAVRIAYECARDVRDIAGGCGGVGAPWEDLTPQQKQDWFVKYHNVIGGESSVDLQFFSHVVDFLVPFVE